ncbi:MDR family oxidoreductase [Corynebacterium tuberculostearicum]|uniref:MDR family oxidoreductase n=1 Tax=Corynebacterium tuberculostearicum TaxID=38304 RepID=UPI0026471B0A|nr:MDR family oxidoreductase [Corynebacterium tuberculostearicum]WKE60565.1 oxidoreductase [Corynebacterium tuberculostearicum]
MVSMSTLLVTRNEDKSVTTSFEEGEFLGEGDLTVDVSYSSLNYKDAMAIAGDRGVMRTSPLVPGIDVVGTVAESNVERLPVGTLVASFGDGLGEFRHGGYTPKQRVNSQATVALPADFTAEQAAAVGTAGYTAALCVNSLRGLPDGPVLVTGATGGVGSIAVNLLSNAGYEVHAMTGRPDDYSQYLHELGAHTIVDRAEFAEAGKPLQKATYAGAVDTSGSHVLANVLARTVWGGTVASTGMAAGPDLPTTVLPFILRNVHLAGVNSVDAPLHYRQNAWQLLARKLDRSILESLTNTIPLSDVVEESKSLLEGTHHGRTVLKIS